MKADLTRNTYNPYQHFARVLMQQGRVQLDADWNEQSAILLHYLQTLAADLIGPSGGPTDHLGFAITPLAAPASPAVANDFRIGLGRYYVDGILCEADSTPVAFTVSQTPNTIHVDQWSLDGMPFLNNQLVELFDDDTSPHPSPAFQPTVVQITNADQSRQSLTLLGAPAAFGTPVAPRLRRVITYLTQPDYPIADVQALKLLPGAPAAGVNLLGVYMIYLDVWERLITSAENDAIREVALGGPDTAARSKVVWQVKAVPGTEDGARAGTPCDRFVPSDAAVLTGLFASNRGLLRARAKETAASADPCIIPPDASYRGPENQLYRVEIHHPGTPWDGNANNKTTAATFKWSRENGSVVFPILSLSSANGATTVTLETLGRDDRLGLAEGQWVEIQDDISALQNRADSLLQIQSIDRTAMSVTLAGTTAVRVGPGSSQHPLLRRWDHQEGDPADGGLQLAADGSALLLESVTAWLNLEDGVQVQFQVPDVAAPHRYLTGDYWLIPARTATGDVEWPTEMGLDSSGNPVVVHLAKPPDGVQHHYAPLAVVSVDAAGAVSVQAPDCRKAFPPLAK